MLKTVLLHAFLKKLVRKDWEACRITLNDSLRIYLPKFLYKKLPKFILLFSSCKTFLARYISTYQCYTMVLHFRTSNVKNAIFKPTGVVLKLEEEPF